MRAILFFLFILFFSINFYAQNNVGIGTNTPNPKSLLDLSATDKGFLAPRLSTAQRLAIAPAGAGDQALLVYDTDEQLFYFWNAAAWIPFPLPGGNNTAFTFNPTTGELSITDPGGTLTVNIPPSADTDSTNELITNVVYNPANQILTLTEAGNTFTVTLSASAGVTGPADAAAFCAGVTSGPIPIMGNPDTLCNSIVYQNGNNIGINTTNPVVSLQINSTNAIAIPSGTTAQQPGGAPAGSMRFNTNLGAVEVFNGTCWQLVNTPPVGSTYIQWASAADPNTIYPCTQWVRTDMNNGEFIRAAGGASNVGPAGPLSGLMQDDALENHAHVLTGTIDGSGILTSSASGGHTHNWGGWWSNDDSRSYDAASGNGDGNGNTLSDGVFWWGGNPATVGSYSTGEYSNVNWVIDANGNHNHGGSTGGYNDIGTGCGNPKYVPYDDNVTEANVNLSGNTNSPSLSCPWNGRETVGAFLGRLNNELNHNHAISSDGNHGHNIRLYAHRHWLKQRPTSAVGDHTHSIPDHAHAHTFAVGNVTGATGAAETRPTNVAVFFWRRTL
jgi:hypothetical protein